MRTRIALAAIIPVAISTVTIASQTFSEPSARAVTVPQPPPGVAVDNLTPITPQSSTYLGLNPGQSFNGWSAEMVNLNSDLVAGQVTIPIANSSPTPPPLPAPRVTARVVRPVAAKATAPAALPFTATAVAAPARVIAPAPAPAPAPVAVAPAATTTSGIVDTVTPAERAAWERVNICEEGGNWDVNGYRFSGGLGITRANWVAYGGLQFAPDGAAATPDEQIMVAERIQFNPPDQHGCASW